MAQNALPMMGRNSWDLTGHDQTQALFNGKLFFIINIIVVIV